MIPVVDLRSDNAVAALRSACEEIGFFTVVGHGVSPAAIDEVAAVSRRFFDQTAEAKARFAGPGSVVGLPVYRPLQSERLGATGDGDDRRRPEGVARLGAVARRCRLARRAAAPVRHLPAGDASPRAVRCAA